MIHIGILQCDRVRPEHRKIYSDYPEMFSTLLQCEQKSITFSTYACLDNIFPEDTSDCDAWIITGSKHACYENLPWMFHLEDFIRALYIDQIPCVGICFGHQIMAQAMGGKVQKSPKGWGVGATTVKVYHHEPWMKPFKRQLNILVSHQDQITVLPDDTRIIAGNDFCPYFILCYNKAFITIQGHPEFTKSYEKVLVSTRVGCIGKECTENALASLDKPVDSALFAKWMLVFFEQVIQSKALQ